MRVEMKLCASLCKSTGMDCLLIYLPYHGHREPMVSEWSGQFFVSPDLYCTVQNFQNVCSEVMTAVHWLKGNRGKRKIGIMGYSIGSVLSVLTLNVEPLLEFGILVAGAAELSGMIWHNTITTHLKRHLIELGISKKDLQKAWSISDPFVLKINISPDKILMFSTRYDKVLRPEYQNRLWEALKRPKQIWLPTGHYTSVLCFNEIVRESADFVRSLEE